MKNQYFGDEHDYKKYGILRCLANSGFRIGVCWMLTPNDGKNDGNFRKYSSQPDKWKSHDPELFEWLYQTAEVEGHRDVLALESSAIIPNAMYYSALLSDSLPRRIDYFDGMKQALADADLILFDPDNGLEIPSKPIGYAESSKYLSYAEAAEVFQQGKSLLIYQQFYRVEHTEIIRARKDQLAEKTGATSISVMATNRMVYFLVSQQKHITQSEQALDCIRSRWAGKIEVS